MASPQISVLMSVYNGASHVAKAIGSVLSQTFGDYEFIVTDDGSTDGTAEILDSFAAKDSRLRIIHQVNAGLTKSLNNMIPLSSGEFLARMDADDVSFTDRFQAQYDLLQTDPAAALAGCWFLVSDAEGPLYESSFPDSPERLADNLRSGVNCFAHGSVMMRRAFLESLPEHYRFRYGQDFDLWLRFAEKGRLRMVEKVLYARNSSPGTISAAVEPRRAALMKLMLGLAEERRLNGRELTPWAAAEARIFSSIREWDEEEAEGYNKFLKARKHLAKGQNREARRLIREGLRLLPLNLKMQFALMLSFFPGRLISRLIKLRDRRNDRDSFMRRSAR